MDNEFKRFLYKILYAFVYLFIILGCFIMLAIVILHFLKKPPKWYAASDCSGRQ